jgi:hypothetical protein
MPIGFLYYPLGGAFLMLLYMKNKRIRLDESGIAQGYSVFSTSIRYERIAGIRKEARYWRGLATEVLVIVEQDSAKRIEIAIPSLDRTELLQFVRTLGQQAPQIRLDDLFL